MFYLRCAAGTVSEKRNLTVFFAALLFLTSLTSAAGQSQAAPETADGQTGRDVPAAENRPTQTEQTANQQRQPAVNAAGGSPAQDATQESRRLHGQRQEFSRQAGIHFRYARELHADGYLLRSLSSYSDFIILYPEDPNAYEAHLETGKILRELGRLEEAASWFLKAHRQGHNQEKGDLAYLEAGRTMLESGELDRARSIFSELIRSRPATRVARLAEIELKSMISLNRMDSTLKRDEAPEVENGAQREGIEEKTDSSNIGEGLEE